MPLETTAEILAKKLRFRMARDKELLPRDLYDLALARERDPPALRTALAALRNDQLGELLETFKDHAARGWPHTQPSLLAPSDPDLAGALSPSSSAFSARRSASGRRSAVPVLKSPAETLPFRQCPTST